MISVKSSIPYPTTADGTVLPSSKGLKMEKVSLPQGLASIPAGAEFLSISRSKVYQLINAGVIPTKRFGKSVRIPWAWLHAQAEVKSEECEVSR